MFVKITPDGNYRIVHIVYPIPHKGSSLKDFAIQLSEQIDTSGKYVFIGSSLGGMICVELADILQPEKVIIISSAKSRHELPPRFYLPHTKILNKLIPKKLMRFISIVAQPLLNNDILHNKEVFASMLKSRGPLYYKRTVNMIVNWKRNICHKDVIHIHGTKDRMIPIANVRADYIINDGSHFITLTRGDEVNKIIQTVLDTITGVLTLPQPKLS